MRIRRSLPGESARGGYRRVLAAALGASVIIASFLDDVPAAVARAKLRHDYAQPVQNKSLILGPLTDFLHSLEAVPSLLLCLPNGVLIVIRPGSSADLNEGSGFSRADGFRGCAECAGDWGIFVNFTGCDLLLRDCDA